MEIKGDRRGLRCLAHGFRDESSLLDDLARTLSRHHQFLGHAELSVEVDDLPLSPTLLYGIAERFLPYPALQLKGVFAAPADRRRALSVSAPTPAGASIVRSTLRSGQVVEHPGDVVVVGDINPGARVIAGGDVYVLGRLRGMALAGQPDRPDAAIFALRFEPSQVRIASVWAIPAGDPAERPEWARLEDGRIVVSPWSGLPEPSGFLHHKFSAD